jgi:pyruvate dehydrogenase E1 component
MTSLGTDGFGRSEGRRALRDFFEVDARHIAVAALGMLLRQGQVDARVVAQAIRDLDIDPERANPLLR